MVDLTVVETPESIMRTIPVAGRMVGVTKVVEVLAQLAVPLLQEEGPATWVRCRMGV